MKVFTVGLEQKPPLEDGEKKSASPPPGYSTTEARIPLPLGPEMPRAPMPPQPIIVRKSRGYKGILLVMLSVFLMAVFALVLSEMAYNRQRDENFFKLRWAELKHRMGYETDGPMEYYQRAAASIGDKFDRMLNLAKSNEINPPVAQSLSSNSVDEDDATTTSTSSPPPTPPEPVVAIDTFPMKPDVMLGSSGSNSRSSQASFEIEPPQPPMFPGAGLGNALGQIRDARLQFLRNILQKIKQHAEDIGFDGTMQVSIIEVEPQNGANGNGNDEQNGDNNNNQMNGMPPFMGPFQRQLIIQQPNQQPQFPPPQFPQMPPPQHFFPHPRPLVDDFKNSRSFLDGFGEFHQPNFMQNNQVNEPEEQPRPRMFGPMPPNEFPPMMGPMPPMMQQQQQNGPPEFMENNMRWPRINPFRQPEMLFFHPIFPQQMNLRFPPPPPPSAEWAQPPQQQQAQQQIAVNPALARPASFDRWSQQGVQQPQQPQQGVLMAGEQPQQQPQQPQAQSPQQQQIQIDFPEVKLPPPVISGDSTEDKFPVAPPQQQQSQQLQQQPQAQQQPRDWLPKWLTENMPTMVNNNAGGPPAQQPAEMVKFPSVTVLEPASNNGQQGGKQIADNENRDGGENAGRDEGKVVDSARGEIGRIDDGQPEEVVEVDAAPQQSEQQQTQQQTQSQTAEGQTQAQGQQQEQQPQQQQPMAAVPLQKWFPEVPSVFFQVDDPNEQQQQQPLVPQAAQQQQSAAQQQPQTAADQQQGQPQAQSEH